MIRKAILKDVNSIEDTYNEHFQYELNHTAFTVFKKGVYPTKDDAERAIYAGALFVYEENGTIVGSIIIDKVQPIEYATIPWKEKLSEDEVMVIHLLMVRPSMSGKGIASSLIKFATELAQKNSCRALRLDTGSQNIPLETIRNINIDKSKILYVYCYRGSRSASAVRQLKAMGYNAINIGGIYKTNKKLIGGKS